MGFAQLECPLYGVHFSEYPYLSTNTLKNQRNTHKFNAYFGLGHQKNHKTQETPLQNGSAAGFAYVPKQPKSLDFKQFSGIEKVHRNSIKITVDLWWTWAGQIRTCGALREELHFQYLFDEYCTALFFHAIINPVIKINLNYVCAIECS